MKLTKVGLQSQNFHFIPCVRAEILAHRVNYNVAAWDWSENAAANPLFVSYTGNSWVLNEASTEGEALYNALLGQDYNYTKDLHLIGHSAGGTVINEAAIKLQEQIGSIVQLTFLDAPEFNLDLASPLDGNN